VTVLEEGANLKAKRRYVHTDSTGNCVTCTAALAGRHCGTHEAAGTALRRGAGIVSCLKMDLRRWTVTAAFKLLSFL
jgi:hypothetical protein